MAINDPGVDFTAQRIPHQAVAFEAKCGRKNTAVIPGRREAANHSASKTRVDALVVRAPE
jgi:hypothetical protein